MDPYKVYQTNLERREALTVDYEKKKDDCDKKLKRYKLSKKKLDEVETELRHVEEMIAMYEQLTAKKEPSAKEESVLNTYKPFSS